GCCGELIAYSTRSRGKGTVLLCPSETRVPTDSGPILAEHRAPVHSFMLSAPSGCSVSRVAECPLVTLTTFGPLWLPPRPPLIAENIAVRPRYAGIQCN